MIIVAIFGLYFVLFISILNWGPDTNEKKAHSPSYVVIVTPDGTKVCLPHLMSQILRWLRYEAQERDSGRTGRYVFRSPTLTSGSRLLTRKTKTIRLLVPLT